MIVKDIEKKLVDAIAAALPVGAPTHKVFGVWQTATAGYVKNEEDGDETAVIAVALGTAQQDTYSTPVATFNGSVVLRVRLDRDITGTALVAFADPIDSLFRTWLSANYQQSLAALTTSDFSCDGFSVQGGTAPQIDFQTKTVTVTWGVMLQGSYIETTNS